MVTPSLRGAVLALVKSLHTLAFLGELLAIVWLVISGVRRRQDRTVALAAAAVATEAVVFIANDHVCPLTPVAERLGATNGSVSDIFLPTRLARTIPVWSTALVAIAAALHVRAVGAAARGPRAASREGLSPP